MNTAAALSASTSGGKGLHIALWVVQVVLAVMFGMAGFMKATQPLAALAQQIPWVPDVPAALVRFIGVAEFAAALGLVLPAATRIRPRLTPLAAVGLVLVMTLAAIFHLTRGELAGIVANAVLGAAAAFVAWGRTRKAPIVPRG